MFAIVDDTGNAIETSTDGGALFARLADLNGPRGDAGYTLRRVDATPPVDAAPPAPPAPVETARVVVPGKTIDAEGAARIATARAILTSSGIAIPEAWFAAGTDMLPCGEAVYHSIARDFDSQIPFVDAAELAINGIRGQNRRDVVVEPGDVSRIRFEDGWLRINGRKARIGMSALRDLMSKYSEVFPAAGRWASVMGRAALEASINDGFDRWGRQREDRPVQLRIRDHSVTGEPVVWAVVGAQYPGRPTDADAILRSMLQQVGGDRSVKGEVIVDPNSGEVTARAVWMDRTIRNPKVGDIFQATLVARTRDDAKGAFTGNGGITAIRCINCSLATSTFGEGRGIHRSQASIDKAVRSAFTGFRKQADGLLSHWGYLTAAELEVEGDDGEMIRDFHEAIPHLIENDADVISALSGVGVEGPAMADMWSTAYAAEREAGRTDNSLADVVRIAAKVAQDRRLENRQRVEMEIASGRLIPVLARRAQESAE